MELNKYERALNFFKKVAHHVPLKSATDEFCEEYDENLIALKELVEKATPKEIEEKEDICDDVEYIYTRGKCPNCKSYVAYDGYDKYDYCQYCGQRLDFGDEDEN